MNKEKCRLPIIELMARHLPLKHLLHWGGSVLAIVGLAFVILRLYDAGTAINLGRFGLSRWLILAGLVLISGLANSLLALAWWNLLGQFGATTAWRWAIRVYGLSQIAKYLPGNIFHLAGRQALGMAAGVPGWPLAKSAAWELGLISFAGGIFSLLALSLIAPAIPMAVGFGLFVVTVAGVTVLLRRYLSPLVASALGLYICFLAISGMLFVGLVELVSVHTEADKLSWIPLCGAYVTAWLVGLVTPGAPAGMGVRELVLLFLLKGIIAETDLVMAVVLGRVVTIGGDFLIFLFAVLMNRK